MRAEWEGQPQVSYGFSSVIGAVPVQLRVAGGARGPPAACGCPVRVSAAGEGRRPAGRNASRLLRAVPARHLLSSAGSSRVPSGSGRPAGAEPPLPPRAPHGDLPAAGAGPWRRTDSSSGQSTLGAARSAPPLQPRGPIRATLANRGAGLPRPGRRFCVCERCAVPAPRGRRRLGGPARPREQRLAAAAEGGVPSPAVVGGPRRGGGVPPRAR